MSLHTRFKFKERLLIGVVGLFFTGLIVLEQTVLKYYAVKPAIKSHRETSAQNDNNEYENNDLNILEFLDSPVLSESQILEEILDDVGGHLAFIRKQLSISGENLDSSDRQKSQVVQHLITNSSIIKKYPDVFIKIAELLESKTKERQDSEDSGHDAQQQESRVINEVDGVLDENVELHYVYGPSHRPRVYNGNVTISHLAKPNGYLKRKGVHFELSYEVVNKIKKVVMYKSKKHRSRRTQVEKLNVYKDEGQLQPHEKWHNAITQYELYAEHGAEVSGVLRQLQQSRITAVSQRKEEGTQLKLYVTHEDGMRSLFKPMRFLREQDTLPDQYYFSDFERHTAEIAAFHLDRLLGFRRAPPVAGRVVHMLEDLRDNTKDSRLRKDYFASPSGNWCYRGDERCLYCENRHLVCARGSNPYLLEGALIASYPKEVERVEWDHPWSRSYKVREAAEWEHSHSYCLKVKAKQPYRTGRRLLDIMDMAVLDFLMGNMDRKHYETFKAFGNDSFIVHMDHGKGFGNPYEDEMTCLAPVTQCCLIRLPTLNTLLAYHSGPIHLSTAMRRSLDHDKVAPVLLEKHLQALDRRVNIILQTVHDCIIKKSMDSVVIDDGLYGFE